ncbi:MAG: caspase family protein [Nitrosopumilus sp.]|nr:caspase family protein [Nitrosopumilus sp.]
MTQTNNQGRKKAMIIAISEYDNFPNLEFVKNDGEMMYKTLKKIGFEISDERKMIGKVDHDTMTKSIKEFFRGDDVKSSDTLLLYYSGHGVPHSRNDYYFVTSETRSDKPDVEGYSYDELSKISRNSNSTKIVKIIDCCYSGALGIASKGDEKSKALIGKRKIEKSFEQEGEGRFVLASSLGSQESFSVKDKTCSVFTYHINQGLNGSEPLAVDEHGYITPYSLGKYVYKKMIDFAKDQRPTRKVDGSGDIFLAEYKHLAKIKDKEVIDSSDLEKIVKKIVEEKIGKKADESSLESIVEALVQKQMSKQQQKSTQETKKGKKEKTGTDAVTSKTIKGLLEKFGGKLEEEISDSISKIKDSDFSESSRINKFESTKPPILFNPIGNWNFSINNLTASIGQVQFTHAGEFYVDLLEQTLNQRYTINGICQFDQQNQVLILQGMLNETLPWNYAITIQSHSFNHFSGFTSDGFQISFTKI